MTTIDEVVVRLTDHARERAAEMGIGTKAVKRALKEPETIYPSIKYPGCNVALRENLAVPFRMDGETRLGITVLWRGKEERA